MVLDDILPLTHIRELMGSEARTRLGLAALLAVTVYSLSQVFQPGGYPGPTLLGISLALGIAVASHRMGLRAIVGLAVSLGALVLYLSLIFEPRSSFYGLPTPASFDGLAREIRHAVEMSSVDYAPVPVRPGYVILVVIGMWVATIVAETATFRWRRPMVASLPCIGMIALVMIVGTGVGTGFQIVLFLCALLAYWSLESSHRLATWGSWLTAWGKTRRPLSVTSASARKMGASCILAALAAPLLLPSINSGLLNWRTPIGDGPGGGTGSSGEINPLVSLAPRLLNQDDRELFQVTSSEASYWKLVTLSDFDGESWRSNGAGLSPGSTVDPLSFSRVRGELFRTLEQRVRLTGLKGEPLPVAPTATEISLGSESDHRADDLRYNPETNDFRLADGIAGEITYLATSRLPNLRFSEMKGARAIDPPGAGDLYRRPQVLNERVLRMLDRWVEGYESDFERLVAIQDQLRLFEYSVDAGLSKSGSTVSTDYLTTFLLETRAGYCQQFATAFALLARQLGYSTRVAVGFLPGDNLESDPASVSSDTAARRGGVFSVRGTDAHAWPEVYFDRWGWVRFEPTPRSDRLARTPAYTFPRAPGLSFGDIASGAPTGSRPGQSGRRGFQDQDRIDRGEAGALEPETPPVNDAWKGSFRRFLTILVALGVLFLIAIPSVKQWRVARRYRRAADPVGTAAAAFAEFQFEAAELASARAPGESAMSFARRLSQLDGFPEGTAVRLALIYEAAQYSSLGIGANVADEARRLARELRAGLWQRASWFNRIGRLFSPARP